MHIHLTITAMVAVLSWVTFPISSLFPLGAEPVVLKACPSGQSLARLTGWMLNNRYPKGSGKYVERTNQIEVTVDNVSLPDGTVLSVLIGEENIGSLPALKAESATGVFTKTLAEGVRVRVFHQDRPVISGNLQCAAAVAANATVSPTSASPTGSPTTTPTATPTPSPSPTLSPAPTAEPTQDPMPTRTPAPTPSPGI